MIETYVKIKGFPDYEISDQGHVRHGTRILKPFLVAKRYLGIHLMKNGVRFCLRINRLVAEHFLAVPEGKNKDDLVVDHKDLDKMNNRVANLEWVTGGENTRRAAKLYGNFRDKEHMEKVREANKSFYDTLVYY